MYKSVIVNITAEEQADTSIQENPIYNVQKMVNINWVGQRVSVHPRVNDTCRWLGGGGFSGDGFAG